MESCSCFFLNFVVWYEQAIPVPIPGVVFQSPDLLVNRDHSYTVVSTTAEYVHLRNLGSC